jgi:hypothetical protein
MRSYSRYLSCLAGAVGAMMLGVVGVSLWLEPHVNDLTRIGDYSDFEYGWNAPQVGFSPPLAAVGDLDTSYDVVVIGDSFTIGKFDAPDRTPHQPSATWPDFLVQLTGLSVGSFHRDRLSPEAYLTSAAYRQHPPRLLVVEVVERELYALPVTPSPCAPAPPGPVFRPALHAPARQKVPIARDTTRRLDQVALDAGIGFLKRSLQRRLTGQDGTEVARVHLSRADLFSSRKPDELLTYRSDGQSAHLTPAYMAELGCALRGFQARVEANRFTEFVLMIAPNKSTAYAAFAPHLVKSNLTERLAAEPGLHLLRLDRALMRAIAAGTKDVYLPSDTHWSSTGKAIAAQTLVNYLEAQYIADAAPP